MNNPALFGLSALMSLVASVVFAQLYLWPKLRTMERHAALASLTAPHMFVRFVGLSFLVPGVASSAVPAAFAVPAAYGDFVAGVLAIVATIALRSRASFAILLAWAFNVWGAGDLLFAGFQGQRVNLAAASLGATFFIPTALVPPLLVTHALMLAILSRTRSS